LLISLKSLNDKEILRNCISCAVQQPRGILDRRNVKSFNMFAPRGQVRDIIVEYRGRIAYRPLMIEQEEATLINS